MLVFYILYNSVSLASSKFFLSIVIVRYLSCSIPCLPSILSFLSSVNHTFSSLILPIIREDLSSNSKQTILETEKKGQKKTNKKNTCSEPIVTEDTSKTPKMWKIRIQPQIPRLKMRKLLKIRIPQMQQRINRHETIPRLLLSLSHRLQALIPTRQLLPRHLPLKKYGCHRSTKPSITMLYTKQ